MQRLVVNDGGAGGKIEHIVAGCFGIHRDEEINPALAADEAVLVGTNGVPRGQAGDVRRKQVLGRNRDAHLEQRPEQNEVGRLTSGAVDGGNLDAEIVNDAVCGCRWT